MNHKQQLIILCHVQEGGNFNRAKKKEKVEDDSGLYLAEQIKTNLSCFAFFNIN